MPTFSLGMVTLGVMSECGAIYVEDDITCRLLRKDQRSRSCTCSENKQARPKNLRIQVEELTPEAFDAVRTALITLGALGPWELFRFELGKV